MLPTPIMRRPCLATVILAAAAFAASPAMAQSAPPPTQQQPTSQGEPVDGHIIYSRDVHHSIGALYFPGEPHSVVTAPARQMVATVRDGLQPLSDAENSTVAASLAIPGMPIAAMPGAHDTLGGETAVATLGTGANPVASSVTGAISTAMGSLTGALAPLTNLGSSLGNAGGPQ